MQALSRSPSFPRRLAAALLALAVGACTASPATRDGAMIPPPAKDPAVTAPGDQVAVLAGGCFWGLQAGF